MTEKTIIPRYRLMIQDVNRIYQMPWSGKATLENLSQYVIDYAKTLEAGGVNENISKKLGYVPYPTSAWIIDQKTNKIICCWNVSISHVW